ncbi:DUF192 domain-containing protein [Geobacter hydrogenophilus]|uniref:DUF192 domain-containing protein n=1 Tax=Geobacter hydrogenophilus TaxID=40983 RepID=A0A9W6G1R0_9BACT|nr:DUF192 domain-containing protein [Geobacter hydrogenophilus]MBT0893237.1 DUF192 domain-containing protein [Geobacter hydrogenophilus]GLI38916.1 hypothetical protein GHYDROH2_24170 [Geobacter hydrogenophilus]
MKAINKTTQTVLADDLAMADTPLKRLVGLLGKRHLPAGKGLLITPCKGVHTLGMRFAIDVLFLGKKMTVVALNKNMLPNRMSRVHMQAQCVLELPAGTVDLTNTKLGDPIAIEPD